MEKEEEQKPESWKAAASIAGKQFQLLDSLRANCLARNILDQTRSEILSQVWVHEVKENLVSVENKRAWTELIHAAETLPPHPKLF